MTDMLNLTFSTQVAKKFPDLQIALLEARDLSDYKSETDKANAEQEIMSMIHSQYPSAESAKNHYLNEHYKTFYREMGLRPKLVSTPIKQVVRRIKTDSYNSVHKVITECMKIEYSTMISFQVYDLDSIVGDLSYRLATGTEETISIGRGPKLCKQGELILVDEEAVLHSVYYGNNERKSVTKDTNNFLIRIMGIPGVRQEDFEMTAERTKLALKATRLDYFSP